MMMASHMDGGDGDDCIVQIVRCDAQERVNSCFNQGGGNWHNWRLKQQPVIKIYRAAHHLAAKKQNRWMIN